MMINGRRSSRESYSSDCSSLPDANQNKRMERSPTPDKIVRIHTKHPKFGFENEKSEKEDHTPEHRNMSNGQSESGIQLK